MLRNPLHLPTVALYGASVSLIDIGRAELLVKATKTAVYALTTAHWVDASGYA